MADPSNPLNSDTNSPGFWTNVGLAMQQGYDQTPWPIKPLGGPYRGIQEALVQGGAAIGPGWERAARDLVSVPDMYAGSPGSIPRMPLSALSRPGMLVGRGVVDPSELGVRTVDPSMRPPPAASNPVPSPPPVQPSNFYGPPAPLEQIPIRFGVTKPVDPPQAIRFGTSDANGPVGAQVTPDNLVRGGYGSGLPEGNLAADYGGMRPSYNYTYPYDPMAHVRFGYDPRSNIATIDQIHTGDFGPGVGSDMIHDALQSVGIPKPKGISLNTIIHQPTLDQLSQGVAPDMTPLGKTLARSAVNFGANASVEPFMDPSGNTGLHARFDYPMDKPAAPASLFNDLTDRQSDVARLVAGGLTEKQIGKALGISDATVGVHKSALLNNLAQTEDTPTNNKAMAALLKENPPESEGPAPVFPDRRGAVADLVKQGLSRDEIGTKLGMATGTVKEHIRLIQQQLGISGGMKSIIDRLHRLRD